MKKISIIIPVKDNQSGIECFLRSFFKTQLRENYPLEIIIVDNNSNPPIHIPDLYSNRNLDIHLFLCTKKGPASARNFGAKKAKGDWFLFVDSDCIATEQMILGYQTATSSAIGYQGSIGAVGNDYLSNYYLSQQIHLPPQDQNGSPKYLVTANTLIQKAAFEELKGFNEEFTIAGGEDIDLAMRLKQIGKLDFAPNSITMHDFDDGLNGFLKRFIRYGKGNRLVKQYHKEVKNFPFPFSAKEKGIAINHILAIIQWLSLFWGYLSMSKQLKNTHNE